MMLALNTIFPIENWRKTKSFKYFYLAYIEPNGGAYSIIISVGR